MLLYENEDAFGIRNAGQGEELLVIRVVDVEPLRIFDECPSMADHRVHGIAPNPFGPTGVFLLLTEGAIQRAFVDSWVAIDVGTQTGFGHEGSIGIIGV